MRDEDKKQFAEMMGAAWSMCGKTTTKPMLAMMFESLRRFELDEVRRGLSMHVSDPDSGQYPPKPADIIRHLEGSKQNRGMVAWSMVEKAIRTVGAYQTVVFPDPAIMAVIEEMGGWVYLCQTPVKEMPFRASEFEKRYQSFAIAPPESYPAALIGIAETSNRANGKEVKPPLLLGDEKRAMLVYQGGRESSPVKAISADKVAGALGYEGPR